MSLPVIILGAGGHAKVLIEALLEASALIAGVVDPDPSLAGSCLLGIPILGGDEVVGEFPPGEIELVNGLGSVQLPARRREIHQRFSALGYRFATVVHPSAVVSREVRLGAGAQIMAGAVLQPGCSIGADSIVNTRASVDHDCSIGEHVHIAPGVTISGSVRVGDGTHIGTGAVIIQGACIGEACLVAAGAVVTKDVTSGTKVRGVPAREFV